MLRVLSRRIRVIFYNRNMVVGCCLRLFKPQDVSCPEMGCIQWFDRL